MAGPLHVRELAPAETSGAGSGTGAGTVVLLHGLTDSGEAWGGAVRRWAPRGWRLVAPDLRGHGVSPRWDDEELAGRPGDVVTRDVVGLLQAVARSGPGPVALLGHSMGGAAAVAAAAAVPHLVTGVIAEDPPWPLPPITRPDPVRARAYLAGHGEDLSLGFAGRIDRKLRETPWWPAEELEPLSRAVEQTDVRLLETGDIVPVSPWPELLRVLAAAGVPVLVVTGTRDARVPATSQAEAERCGARVVRVEGAGHCVRRDRPEDYHAVVDVALEQWLTPGRGSP